MTNFRKMTIAAAATMLMASQLQAAEVAKLPAGKPAGVKEAQGSPNMLMAIGVGVAVAGGLAIALTNSGDSGGCGAACNPPTNTTTSSTP